MARRRRARNADTNFNANLSHPSNFSLDELLRPVEPMRSPVSYLDNFLAPDLPFDRRQFSFGQEVEAYTLSSSAPAEATSSMSTMPVDRVAFTRPNEVAICHRRAVRKEVLIAKRKRGRGGSRRRDWRSEVKC